MNKKEFADGMKILIDTYPGYPPGANWPQARVAAFLKAFSALPDGVFLSACAAYMENNLHPPSIDALKECVARTKPTERLVDDTGRHRNDILNPDVPEAAELARRYVPEILKSIRRWFDLPYDKNERIEREGE